MYIKEFFIDRFGVFSGQAITDLPPGLTVILGRNEAGKSTCLNFFRAMLFGYARDKRNRFDYLADQVTVAGAKALSGGSLLLETKAYGPLRLTRRPGPHGGPVTLSTPQGAPHPTAELARLLGGCTPEVYDTVFGFSLGELIHMGDMKDERIRHALHGAAFGAERSPTLVLKKIQDEMDRLYVPKGRKTHINVLMAELEELREQRRERGSEVARYGELQQQLETLEHTLEEESAARAALEEEQRLLDRRVNLWRQWEALRQAETVLEALPQVEGSVAPDGQERLNRLCERLEERRLALAEATRRQERFSADMSALTPAPGLLQAHSPLMALREQAESLRRGASELPALEQEERAAIQQLQALYASLGPEWDGDAVRVFPLSLALREECRSLGQNLEKSERDLERAEQEAARLEREILEAEQADAAARQPVRDLSSEPGQGQHSPTEEDTELLARALVQAQDALEQLPAQQERLRHAGESLASAVQAASRQASLLPDLYAPAFAATLGPEEELARLQRYLTDHADVDEQALERRRTLLVQAQNAWLELEAARRRLQDANERLNDFVIPQYAPPARGRDRALLLGGAGILGGLACLVAGFVLPLPALTYVGVGCLVAGVLLALMRQSPMQSQAMAASTLETLNERFKAARNSAGDVVQAAERQLNALFASASGTLGASLAAALEGLPASEALSALKEHITYQEQCLALERKMESAWASLRALHEQQEALRLLSRRFDACLERAHTLPGFTHSPNNDTDADGRTPWANAPVWLPKAAQALAQWRHFEQERLRLRQSDMERRSALERLRNRLTLAQKDVESVRAQTSGHLNNWRQWLAEQGFASELSPETARKALDLLDKAKILQNSALNLTQRGRSLQEDLRRFARELGECASLMGEAAPDVPERFAPVAAAELLSILDSLSAKVTQAMEGAALQRRKEAELPEAEAARMALQDQVSAGEAELAELLQLARAEDVEAYRRIFSHWQQREEALQHRQRLYIALQEDARGLPGGFDALRQSFSNTNREELDAEAARVWTLAAQAREKEQALLEQRGRLRTLQQALLGEEGVMALRAREEFLLEALRQQAGEWSRLALARRLLLDAKSRFEQERQPGVVRHAGELFSAITDGAYTGLSVSLEDGSFNALTSGGQAKNPETELSRGTREQLYLALRLAYIHDHSHDHTRQVESLPVIMDDILVNFDAGRAALTAKALAEFSREHQILFFTCHETTAAMLRDAAPGAGSFVVEAGMLRAGM